MPGAPAATQGQSVLYGPDQTQDLWPARRLDCPRQHLQNDVRTFQQTLGILPIPFRPGCKVSQGPFRPRGQVPHVAQLLCQGPGQAIARAMSLHQAALLQALQNGLKIGKFRQRG